MTRDARASDAPCATRIDDLTDARHRQDDRPLAAPAGAGRRVRRGRLPAGRRVRRGLGLRPPGRRRAGRGDPRRHRRRGRDDHRVPARQPPDRRPRCSRPARALADGATELDMVIQIGALKSGRDAEVQADIAAVVEVAHAAGAIVKVIFENAYLTDDEKIRACRLTEAAGGDFVKTSHRASRPTGRHPRRPAPDAGQHLAARPGQGRRRRPDARRAAGGHGPRRDPDRRDGDRDDHRRLPGPQGRRRRRSRAPPAGEGGY